MVTFYTIGKIFEYIVKDKISKKGYITFRCAGSRPFDILAISGGTIYFHICNTKEALKDIIKKFKEYGYVVIRQSKRSVFICLKQMVVIILMVSTLPNYKILNELEELHIKRGHKIISVLDLENDFFKQANLEKCKEIRIIECKVNQVFDVKQLEEFKEIYQIIGVPYIYVAVYMKTYIDIIHYLPSFGKISRHKLVTSKLLKNAKK